MPKSMTVNEAVDKLKLVARSYYDGAERFSVDDVTKALAVLDGKRLCDEAEVVKMMKAQQRMLVAYRTGGTPPQWAFDGCGAANRWLAKHGGE